MRKGQCVFEKDSLFFSGDRRSHCRHFGADRKSKRANQSRIAPIHLVCDFADTDRETIPPTESRATVGEDPAESGTHGETVLPLSAPAISQTQPAEKEEVTNATTEQTTTTQAQPPLPQTNSSKMGDARTIDGQKQVYILGFGWIDDNDEPNVGIVVDGLDLLS